MTESEQDKGTVLNGRDYEPYAMETVARASSAGRFTVVSTFSGGGGSSIGYRLAGGAVLLASEFVPEAVRTYRANFPTCPIDPRDIRSLMREVDGAASFLAAAGIKPNELDVLDGSPPCCEFSAAGKGMRDQHELRRYSDVKQRDIATLPFDFVDLAVRIQPKVVVCENVPALAAQRSRGVLDRIVGALRFSDGVCRDRRYYADWAVLAANDFGVPQKRRRLFIIGVRVDVAESVGLKSDGDVLSLFPKPTGIGPTVASALFGLQQSSRDVFPWYRSAAATSLGATIRRLPKNPAKPIRLRHVSLSETRSFTLTRCSWDKPAPTLVVVAQQPTALSGAIHPDQDRKFTIPELKRLFALPDDFVLTGTLGQAAERICRMVPPPLTEAIAESVYHRVLLPYREGGRR